MKRKALWSTFVIALTLSACGGSALTQLAEGGIGGTGISSGSITGFGSIFVNGVEYDVSQAVFVRDGLPATDQEAYAVGEYVTVQGTVNSDGVTGTATSVTYNNALQGMVTAVSSDNKTVEVLGQTVTTSALTILDGFQQLTDLVSGSVVEVSGVRAGDSTVLASRIHLLTEQYTAGDTIEVKGVVQSVDSTYQRLVMGNLTIDYSAASLQDFPNTFPEVGQMIEVQSQQDLLNGVLVASSVEYEPAQSNFSSGALLELEGVITRFTNSSDFAINNTAVITQTNTVVEGGSLSDLALNAFVEVEGTVNDQGVLVASKIDIKRSDAQEINEIEGQITALDTSTKSLVVAGVTLQTDNSTIWDDDSNYAVSHMNFASLNIGDYIEAKTKVLTNGQLVALRIKREDGESD